MSAAVRTVESLVVVQELATQYQPDVGKSLGCFTGPGSLCGHGTFSATAD